MRPEHERDEDCDVDPETDSCRSCGVLHGDPCVICSGRGFHRQGCPESDEEKRKRHHHHEQHEFLLCEDCNPPEQLPGWPIMAVIVGGIVLCTVGMAGALLAGIRFLYRVCPPCRP